MPSTGTLDVFHAPNAPFIRLDSGVEAGDTVSMHYDPQLAKLSVFAPTRELALSRMIWALQRTAILGVQSNVSFLAQLLQQPDVIADQIHTQWLTPERVRHVMAPLEQSEPEKTAIALAVASVAQWQKRTPSQQPLSGLSGSDPYSPWQIV
jgi:3-methylcrotonyl-CoA carboxylase alpha subunit